MVQEKTTSDGYALITSMIVLAVITALVVGFITQVNTGQKIGLNDLDYTSAFYAAEAGLEKLNADLSKLFLQSVFPTSVQLSAIQGTSYRPAMTTATYPGYSLIGGNSTRLSATLTSSATTASVLATAGWPASGYFMIDGEEIIYAGLTSTTFTGLSRGANGSTAAAHSNNATVSRSKVITIAEGPSAGLNAQVIPFSLEIVAGAGVGTEAKLTREVQVALIPVFQFGVFSDSDLSFFAGPDFNFGGRVHSNGNLFLAQGAGGTLTLAQKVTTAAEVIRQELANGVSTGVAHTGTVRVVTTPGNYRDLAVGEGSVTGGPGSSANSSWPSLSLTSYNGNILSQATGGKPLTLPFVGGGASPVEIIKRPPAGEDPISILGQSRLYNQSSLRILISDATASLPGGVGYPLNDALYGGPYNYTVQDTAGPPIVFRPPFARADPNDPDFRKADNADEDAQSALIDGFVKIERQNVDGTWTDVSMEILDLGIATNQANAILRFQTPRPFPLDATNSLNATDYLPINTYDAREARFRDDDSSVGGNLRKMGVMNLVELDVNNLRRWFSGTIGTTGTQALTNSGYIVYFSDRRGNRNAAGNETGEFGFEDYVNPGDAEGDPDGALNAGEDLNGDGSLQTYGTNSPIAPYSASTDLYATSLPVPKYIDLDEDLTTTETGINVTDAGPFTVPGYYRLELEWLNCTAKAGNTLTCTRGQFGTANVTHDGDDANVVFRFDERARKNRVHYFRRALRLVNGANTGTVNVPGPGFTVTSENPVYVMGNYNSNGAFDNVRSFSAVIADAVTLLSNAWINGGDERSFRYPYDRGSRDATTTWYRMAIAAGKGINFPRGAEDDTDFGTDGGTHNFLRYLEDWGGVTSNYRGSIVSLYYYRQAVGSYKCCDTVYAPPSRAYAFDTDFLVPSQLPPGTPRFRDINNLSFRQTIRAD